MRQSAGRPAGVGIVLCAVALLAGCVARQTQRAPAAGADRRRELVDDAIPARIPDRAGWSRDILAAFASLGLDPTAGNVCAVTAVIEQESGFTVDPQVPNLPAIARRELDARASSAGVPRILVDGLLKLTSRDGRTYGERIDRVRTERDLSDIYEDFIATVPLGSTLFADRNPIRTRGPMQVHVVFAEEFARRHPYPYPIRTTLADEVFTRRGGLYFGVAHLIDYPAPYDKTLYRFADFNAGQYASRNAAFQAAAGAAAGAAIRTDGALLAPDAGLGETESLLRTLSGRLRLDDAAIHDSLLRSKREDFAQTELYRRVFSLAESRTGRVLPRAVVPRIELHGPKISRHLTTAWYAARVDARFARCLRGTG